MEKKLAASEKKQALLTDAVIPGMVTSVNEKVYGEGAIVIHMGQEKGLASQLILHRSLGNVPSAQETNWYLSTKTVARNISSDKGNPYQEKTQEAVSKLKVDFGLSQALLKKNSTGQICYPDGTVRETVLSKARDYAEIHAKCEGGKPLVPTFAYAIPEVQKLEIAYLNGLAESKVVVDKITEVTKLWQSWEAADPHTGEKLAPMAWAEGIPAKSINVVLLDVIRTGSYNKDKWDLLKEKPAKKVSPFSAWGYMPGNYPAEHHRKLLEALDKFAAARKEYNISKQSKDDSPEHVAQKQSLHDNFQKEAKNVNSAEKFEYKPHVAYDPAVPEDAPMSKSQRKKAKALSATSSEPPV
jgi:hypothetical protein